MAHSSDVLASSPVLFPGSTPPPTLPVSSCAGVHSVRSQGLCTKGEQLPTV